MVSKLNSCVCAAARCGRWMWTPRSSASPPDPQMPTCACTASRAPSPRVPPRLLLYLHPHYASTAAGDSCAAPITPHPITSTSGHLTNAPCSHVVIAPLPPLPLLSNAPVSSNKRAALNNLLCLLQTLREFSGLQAPAHRTRRSSHWALYGGRRPSGRLASPSAAPAAAC